MSVKIVLLLFILVLPLTLPKRHHKCSQLEPPNCKDHPSIKVNKTDQETYQLTLCLNNQQNKNITFRFSCDDICEVCETLKPESDYDCQNKQQCEIGVDMFLNDYCASASLDHNLSAIHTPINPNQTTPATNDFPCFQSETEACTPNLSQSGSQLEANNTAVLALGISLGLCVMLLLMVMAGWVHTCRALKTLKQTVAKNNQEEWRTAEESTDRGDEEERHVNNPLHEESNGVHEYPLAPKQDDTNMPLHEESFNQNDAILNIIESEATTPLSTVDDPKEKYLKNPIYEGSLEYQEDRFYERENYDCSQDDDDDYMYDALEQRRSPERDTASKSNNGLTARHEENEEMSSICDFPVARYDAVSRPCYEEGEDYDVLDREIHIGSSRVAASSFECNEEKYLKNPIYEGSPCSDKLVTQDFQALRFDRAISSLQDDGQLDYDVLVPESDIIVATNMPTIARDEDKLLESLSHVGGPKAVVATRPCDLPIARYDTVNLPSHDEGDYYNVLERTHEVNGQTPVRDNSYYHKSHSHLDL